MNQPNCLSTNLSKPVVLLIFVTHYQVNGVIVHKYDLKEQISESALTIVLILNMGIASHLDKSKPFSFMIRSTTKGLFPVA